MARALGNPPSFWRSPNLSTVGTVASLVWNGGSAATCDIDSWTGEASSTEGVNELYFSFAQRDTNCELFFDGRKRHMIQGGGLHVLFVPTSSKVDMKVSSHRSVDALVVRLTNGFVEACAESADSGVPALFPTFDAMDPVDWLFARVIREECRRGAPNGLMGVEMA